MSDTPPSAARTRAALVACVVLVLLFATTQALAARPFATGDEQAHLDYAYQVWHGRLPVFEEGLVLRPPGAQLPPVQWTAQHPPLFYALLAPLVGPLADHGHVLAALYAARAVCVLLAGLLVVAVWWAARGLTDARRSVVAAYVVACCAVVAQVAGVVFNDMLAAVLVTVLLGLGARAARDGLTPRRVALLVLVAAVCTLTRTSAGVAAAVCLAVVGLSALVRARRDPRQGWLALALAAGAAVAVAAVSGWFYLRNLRLTGSVTGGNDSWAQAHQGRAARSLLEVALDPVTWGRLPNFFWWGPTIPRGLTVVLLVAVPALGGLVALVLARRAGLRPEHRAQGWSTAVATAVVVVAIVIQLAYATGGGGIYPRYLLPVVLPFAVAIARGLLPTTRGGAWWHGAALIGWTALVLVDFAIWSAHGHPGAPGAALIRFSEMTSDQPSLTGAAYVTGALAVVVAALACWLVLRAATERAEHARAQ